MWIIMNKVEDLLNASKLGELFRKQKKQDHKIMILCIIASIIGVVAIVMLCCKKCKYKKLKSKPIDDLENEYEVELEDDFFEDDLEKE